MNSFFRGDGGGRGCCEKNGEVVLSIDGLLCTFAAAAAAATYRWAVIHRIRSQFRHARWRWRFRSRFDEPERIFAGCTTSMNELLAGLSSKISMIKK
jgi:hypothetical protein